MRVYHKSSRRKTISSFIHTFLFSPEYRVWYYVTMQSNKDYALDWLVRRGITTDVLSLFNIKWHTHPLIGGCIRIPIGDGFAKYRRDPLDDSKPKYLYDKGGKVTLYGLDQLQGNETEIVVTEGELDALVLWSMNIPAVSSTGGAMSFRPEWLEVLPSSEKVQYYVAFDNDAPGAEGMVRAREVLGPATRVIIIPKIADDKDISDFVARGGDFRALMSSAKSYATEADVEEDVLARKGMMLSTLFHQKYLDSRRERVHQRAVSLPTDEVLRARSFPMTNLLDFTGNKAVCPFHNEKTPSLHYYTHTNSAYCFGACGRAYDSIDLYRQKHPELTFRQAVAQINTQQ